MSKSILSYLFSLFGFVPIESLQEQRKVVMVTQKEEACHYLTSSTFAIPTKEQQTYTNEKVDTMQDWLFNLSKITLCQILTTTLAEYPQVADGIYSRHYARDFYTQKKSLVHPMDELKSISFQANQIAHSLDKLRPSEQFGRASEVATAFYQLLHHIDIPQHHHSFNSLFGLIILAHESLNCPPEVRQHVFADAKFGRTIILELSKILKNLGRPFNNQDINHQWSLASIDSTSWFDTLQEICTKLARYDITWEFRREYQDVILMSERYYRK